MNASSPPLDPDTPALGDEHTQVQALIEAAHLSAPAAAAVQRIARGLAQTVRDSRWRAGGLDALMHRFPLNSAEGLALMGLAEALLRIPDAGTARRLLRDQLAQGDWRRPVAQYTHVGPEESLFANLALTGLWASEATLAGRKHENLWRRLLAKVGEPVVALAFKTFLHVLGKRFVLGETIEQALRNSSGRVAQGYCFSYDMLGEAALTAQDALHYTAAYEHCIHAVGKSDAARAGRNVLARPSVSVKLSALHPRFERAQRERVLSELVPRLTALMRLAHGFGIGLSVDAEEARRLGLTLDVLEAVARNPELAGFEGIGFVVQAYNRQALQVIDRIEALAHQTGQRFLVRLVKGAYWDAEIKRAQMEGHPHYPVYTHKVATDVAYMACARRLFAAGKVLYPQFATHNAHTAAAIYALGRSKAYEYQCLHGMGESLYDHLIGRDPGASLHDDFGDDFEEDPLHTCRIYAPVGPHETLLAYLVRRLLENGANNSFVNRVLEPGVAIDTLVADPVNRAQSITTTALARPAELYGNARRNSLGVDLSDEDTLRSIEAALRQSHSQTCVALPLLGGHAITGAQRMVLNPARYAEAVGVVVDTPLSAIPNAVTCALAATAQWAATPVDTRAQALERAADLLQARHLQFVALAVREAGKTWGNAVAEVREAIDFLRYYAAQAREVFISTPTSARGPLVAISPWNFPLAIFVGQVSAALVAGNPVLAKPAEQTPLMAAAAVAVLHEAGIPSDVLQLLPGPGETVGAALVADPRIAGVLFTGSLAVARTIEHTLAQRDHEPTLNEPLLIAETGGINAMIVDSSALPEQVVSDVLSSAFDSAGQRCSALRVLCVQNEIADRVLALLKGAMDELVVGDPVHLATDIGPVIDAAAQTQLLEAIEALKSSARSWHQARVSTSGPGTFVPPTLAEIERVQNVKSEIFGPVLHVVRFAAEELSSVIDAINASGYGLTHGVHSRIGATVAQVVQRVRAGNIYVNRNMVGAVVGVQPFGGEGMSGTGPKAGGPLYLRALVRPAADTHVKPLFEPDETRPITDTARRLLDTPLPALDISARTHLARRIAHYSARNPLFIQMEVPGPTGERNTLSFAPRGLVACVADALEPLALLCAAALACGNRVVLPSNESGRALAAVLADAAILHPDPAAQEFVSTVLFDGSPQDARALRQRLATRPGAIVKCIHAGTDPIDLIHLVVERCVSVNTTAWGGNAALMSRVE